MAKVLVVDDLPTTQHVLIRVLTREGHEVSGAASGREAIELMQTAPPDLILLDVMMPEMDGFQLLEVMRENPKWKSIPVVMLTALSDTLTINRAAQLGARAYLVKTAFSLQELIENVRQFTASPAPP